MPSILSQRIKSARTVRATGPASPRCIGALLLGSLLAGAPLATPVRAYTFQPAPPWPQGTVNEFLELGEQVTTGTIPSIPATGLTDGSTSWNQVAQNALAVWNSSGALKITAFNGGTIDNSGPGGVAFGNSINNVSWGDNVYGEAWSAAGGDAVAITLYAYVGNQRTEADIIFNDSAGIAWDSYRGALKVGATGAVINDFRRIALHEFGHVLGLDHPDQAYPFQNVTAVMNSQESSTDNITADDTAGALALYGAVVAPQIVVQPGAQVTQAGGTIAFSAVANGTPPLAYQWYFNGTAIAGANAASISGTLGATAASAAASAGNYTVTVSNTAGTVTSAPAVLTVTTGGAAPTVGLQPLTQILPAGSKVTLTVLATSSSTSPITNYQWNFDGVPIPGAAGPGFNTYVIPSFLNANAGSYSVTVTNASGTTASSPATLSIVSAAPSTSGATRFINIASRAQVGTGANVLIAGFVIGGTGTKSLLIRGVGPGLAPYGVTGTLADPALSLYTGGATPALVSGASNTGWKTSPNSSATAQAAITAAIGGGIPNTASDSALLFGTTGAPLAGLAPGAYTAQVAGASSDSGVALVEVDEENTSDTALLANIATRSQVSGNTGTLVAGFTIQGTQPMNVLIRADGPVLGTLGVQGALAQPVLTLFNASGTPIATNTVWGTNSNAALIPNAPGPGFALPSGSADSALLISLQPGAYTAQISGANGSSGVALIELYRIP